MAKKKNTGTKISRDVTQDMVRGLHLEGKTI